MKPLDPLQLGLAGTRLIEASAGTGKTYTLTLLYLRLILERELGPGEVLVVTFTRAATAELRDRLRKRLVQFREMLRPGREPRENEEPLLLRYLQQRLAQGRESNPEDPGSRDRGLLDLALRALDEAAVLTIHAFCQRVLQDHAFESGTNFDSELETQTRPLLEQIVDDFWVRETSSAPGSLVRHLRGAGRGGPNREGLRALALKAAAHPQMPILLAQTAGDGEALPLPELEERWLTTRERALACWQADDGAALVLVGESPALNRNKYQVKTVQGWQDELPALLRGARPGRALPTWLKKLTPEALERGTKKGQEPPQHPLFPAVHDWLQQDQALDRALHLAGQELMGQLAERVRVELPERLQEQGLQSFDELLHRLHSALCGSRGAVLAEHIRRRFPAALIDEFQDTDPVQYEIFRRLYRPSGADAEGCCLLLIGDPKQAIYAFRGADIFAYLRAVEDAAERRTLALNWRSDPGLLDFVNHLFARAPRPFLFHRIAYQPVDPSPGRQDVFQVQGRPASPVELLVPSPGQGKLNKQGRLLRSWCDQHLPRLIAQEIANLLAAGSSLPGSGNDDSRQTLQAGDVAVLCRTNRQARQMANALAELELASVVQGESNVFASQEAEELEQVLWAMAEPTHAGRLRVALSSELLGLDAPTLLDLEQDSAAWERWASRFREWGSRWRQRGFIPALGLLLAEAGMERRLLAQHGGERRLADLRHLAELLQEQQRARHLGPEALLAWLARMRAEAARGRCPESHQVRLETDRQAVQLVTVHKAKGLEYPVVYCPFLWRDQRPSGPDSEWAWFHDPDTGDRLTLDLGSSNLETNKQRAAWEILAEDLRLAYVALTRARHRLSVVWGPIEGIESTALARLLHAGSASSKTEALAATDSDTETRDADTSDAEKAAEWMSVQREQEHVAALSEGEVLDDLKSLARSVSAVELRELSPGLALASATRPMPLTANGPRQAQRTLTAGQRSSSFSALTSRAAAPSRRPPAAVGEGVGEALAPQLSAAQLSDEDEGPDLDQDTDLEPSLALQVIAEQPAVAVSNIPLADFPAGVGPGTMLHRVMEHLDFTNPQDLEAMLEAALAKHGLDLRWRDPLAAALHNLLNRPLGGTEGPVLGQVRREHRLDELEFLLSTGDQQIDPAALSGLFARHGVGGAGYAEQLAQLGFEPLRGHLRGFIDLVFRHQGRWYLVDYKSNRLGPRVEDYGPEPMAEVMAHHHYLLQAHLYAVALRRHLRRFSIADPDARPEHGGAQQMLGGCFYLFLRAFSPGLPDDPDYGVWGGDLNAALVEDLDRMLGARLP